MNMLVDPSQEGHVKEWADRARVELDPEENVKLPSSPKQSPEDVEDVEEKSDSLKKKSNETPY